MKILIVNSDSPNNRGDRAILEGGIKLIRQRFPNSDIWSTSEMSERDKEWYGINFLPMSVHTTNPFKLLRLGLFARRCDIVFWGGGELLKDYTNKFGLIYWVVKMLIVRIFNEKLYGFYQGIGPTKSLLARKLIAFIVNQTKRFFVRDEESAQKLREWGAKTPITPSFDPAILCSSQPLSKEELAQLAKEFDTTSEFLKKAIGIGARNWFHYKTSSWIPIRYLRMFGLGKTRPSSKSEQYKIHLAKLCDKLIEEQDANVIFFPMHTSIYENDVGFSRQVQQLMKNKTRVRIIAQDTLSPQAFHNTIGACRAFIGFRLHSFILATVACIPAVVFYYVDKGRVFADQIGMSDYCWPIEDLLKEDALRKTERMISKLVGNHKEVGDRVAIRLNMMRIDLITVFNKTFS